LTSVEIIEFLAFLFEVLSYVHEKAALSVFLCICFVWVLRKGCSCSFVG